MPLHPTILNQLKCCLFWGCAVEVVFIPLEPAAAARCLEKVGALKCLVFSMCLTSCSNDWNFSKHWRQVNMLLGSRVPLSSGLVESVVLLFNNNAEELLYWGKESEENKSMLSRGALLLEEEAPLRSAPTVVTNEWSLFRAPKPVESSLDLAKIVIIFNA